MGGIISTFRKLWARPWPDWMLLAHVTVLTSTIRIVLTFVSLRTTVRSLRQLADKLPRTTKSPRNYRERAAWAAHVVGHCLLPKRPCLTQALVLQYLLLRRGDKTTELKIGVARGGDDGIRAHAWVEKNGEVLIGGENSPLQYKKFRYVNEKIMNK